MNTRETDTSAESQAVAQVRSVVDMIRALDVDYDRLEELADTDDEDLTDEDREELAKLKEDANGNTDLEEAEQAIDEDPLSVEVRSGWETIGTDLTPSEYRIVLCTGGPHVDLRGDIDERGDPHGAVRVHYADWGTSGQLFNLDDEERKALARYVGRFIMAY